jgi:hypothetical protein
MGTSRVGVAVASSVMTVLCLGGFVESAGHAGARRPVPAQFSKVCSRPGTTVVLTEVPVVVPRARCNLTGVMIRCREAGATVPTSGHVHEDVDTIMRGATGGGYAITGGASITIDVDPASGDVTISR